MSKEGLVQKINEFLEENPFDDVEIKMWHEKMERMNEAELNELYKLLQEKLNIISKTNQLFVDMAEEIVEEQKKNSGKIPRRITLIDLHVEDLARIFKTRLARYLTAERFNFIEKLDEYFYISARLNENAVEGFDLLIKAIMGNEEVLFRNTRGASRVKINEWLNWYSYFNDNPNRKSIDRINFVSQDDRAKKLTKEGRSILLRLLKLYDYLINPEYVSLGEKEELLKVRQQAIGLPKTEEEKKIEKLSKIKRRFKEGSLEEKVIEEAGIQKERRKEDLKILAKQHKKGSLERKAIEEEIRKLESKK